MRAEEHFCHFKLRITRFQQRQVYPVSEGFESYKDGRVYVWRLSMPPIEDEMLTLIVGDLLFNVRSALDHLALALVPPERRDHKTVRAIQFPIFTRDIDELDPVTGKYRYKGDRARWIYRTKGINEEAIPTLKWLQPYNFETQGLDPEHSSLAILNSLQNADKHRQLTVLASGIDDPVYVFTKPDGVVVEDVPDKRPVGTFLGNATAIDVAVVNDLLGVQMEMAGTPRIYLGEGGRGPYRECPDCLAAIIDNGWDCVAWLERFLPPELTHDPTPEPLNLEGWQTFGPESIQ